MAALNLWSHQVGMDLSKLSKKEIFLLEIYLFLYVCNELKEHFREKQHKHFLLVNFNKKRESTMLEADLTRLIVNDILSTGEYNLNGIAYYTDSHEDVIQEIVDGRNLHPSALLLKRSMELHQLVRKELYDSILKKISTKL